MTTQQPPRLSSLAQAHEYSPRASGLGSRRLRLFYFGASAIWGFMVGVAGLLLGLGLVGESAVPTFPAVLGLVPAAGVAIAGAGIIAGAYGEAKRRRR